MDTTGPGICEKTNVAFKVYPRPPPGKAAVLQNQHQRFRKAPLSCISRLGVAPVVDWLAQPSLSGMECSSSPLVRLLFDLEE